MQRIALLLAMGATVLLAACGGAGGGGSVPCSDDDDNDCPTPTPPPQICAYPSGTAPHMIYPAEGATNVPDSSEIEVADAANSLQTWLPASGNFYYAYLFTHPATQVDESNFNGPQSTGFTQYGPMTNLIELNSGPFYTGGPIMPHTHYYVYLEYSYQDGSGNQCYANGPIGDFTTQ